MDTNFDIIGIESPCMDFALLVDQLPRPNLGADLYDYSWQGGGKISTGMIAAARLGAKCALMGIIGDDIFGDSCVADFARHGVITDYLHIQRGTTSLSVVISDAQTSGRSIIHKKGTSSELTEDVVDFSLIPKAKYFFLSKFTPLNIKACEVARQNGVQVFMDADSYTEGMEQYISLVDIFVASEFVYDALFADDNYEANCKRTMDMGPHIVIYTFGEKGCVGIDKDGYFHLPAFSVPVVDTLGAGDVFHGGFLAGLLQGWPTKEVARFASAVAALKCTSPGGRSGIPDMPTVQHFLDTGEILPQAATQRFAEYRRGLEHIK